jgi:two-component system LytT family response regulator
MIKALIIDDEAKARNILQHYLTSVHAEVGDIRQAGSVDEALRMVTESAPDLVFLDIEMPNKNGFEFLVESKDPTFDVIFTTAYNQYAIQAIRFSALDYLLKPIDPDELQSALNRHIEKRHDAAQKKALFDNLVSNIKKNEVRDFKIAVPSSDGVHFFLVDDILRLEADRSYTHIHLLKQRPFIASRTLKHFEDMLEEFRFVRTHKSHLVNARHISRVANNHDSVILTDGTEVEISRRKKEEVLQYLQLR